jgi:hypothetical protein
MDSVWHRRGLLIDRSRRSIPPEVAHDSADAGLASPDACSARANVWHLDELCLVINGQRRWLWWVVDDTGEVRDILVQRRRSAPRRGASFASS